MTHHCCRTRKADKKVFVISYLYFHKLGSAYRCHRFIVSSVIGLIQQAYQCPCVFVSTIKFCFVWFCLLFNDLFVVQIGFDMYIDTVLLNLR